MKEKYLTLLLVIGSVFSSCKSHAPQPGITDKKTVKNSVLKMMANIAADVSNNGAGAWLNYFEDSPQFFMANEGQIAFSNYSSARVLILNSVVKTIPHIKLMWDHLKIDPLNDELASIGAGFHEDQALANGKNLSIDGYFTGIAHYDGQRWKLRNCHWSVKVPSGKNR